MLMPACRIPTLRAQRSFSIAEGSDKVRSARVWLCLAFRSLTRCFGSVSCSARGSRDLGD